MSLEVLFLAFTEGSNRSALASVGALVLATAVAWLALDRKSTRLNSSHTDIYTLALHDALPIYEPGSPLPGLHRRQQSQRPGVGRRAGAGHGGRVARPRSEEHTSELQSHRYLHSCPTRRSSDL